MRRDDQILDCRDQGMDKLATEVLEEPFIEAW